MFKLLLLVLILEVRNAEEYEYIITRKKDDFDRFILPSFLCTSRWESECTDRGGVKTRSNCTCQCPKDRKDVFGYFNKSWKCASNEDVRRKYSGCNFVDTFLGETFNSSLRVATPGKNNRVLIGRTHRSCYHLGGQISYLNCHGEWKQQRSSIGFRFIYNSDSIHDYELYHRNEGRFNRYRPKIYGHVIKLNMVCSDDNGNDQNYCVLLKVQGTQNCPVILPTTSPFASITTTMSKTAQTTKPSTSSMTLPTTQSNEQTTDRTTSTDTLTTTISQKSKTMHPITGFSSQFQSVETTTLKPAASDGITNSPHKGKSDDTNGNVSSGTIGGAVGGVAALVVVVVILIAILRRRNKERDTKEKRESVTPIQDNPSYHNAVPVNGQLEFPDDDEYSYAYTNNHPIVIKDQNGKAVTGTNANGHNRNINGVFGSPPNQQAPVYSTLEDPNYAKLQKSANTSKGPSYNTLERPENQWTTKQGPVYDVLQDPNTLQNKDGPIYSTLKDPNEPSYNTLERPENKWMTKQGPVYDVLEDPNSTGGPVYSVLEAPNSNDQQVYNALEGQDPNVYGSLDSPDPHVYGALYSPTSKSAPVAYDNDIYDSAGGTIIDEDTYQELNQTDQRSSDIYQPVRPPRNTMAMKNMSGITQSQA